ncbi:MAG: hypothetical protein M3R65_05365 [Gemmatimonadota bacterium]|nr:hypothetical protein [Gemmatimonadota bacterium]
MNERLSSVQAALRLRLSYQQVRAQLLAGEIEGGEDERGRFFVTIGDSKGEDSQAAVKP